ncbi:hypothetical protein ACFVP8_03910 [Viridibacillus arvi]|uniref:hypothetical protein n=1 Tax=Viridibacillus arvi TaxID=263475 RepID=UPI0036AEAB03
MVELIDQYEEDGYIYKKYSSDGGATISHEIKEMVPVEYIPPEVPPVEPPTLEEMQAQTLINTEYLVVMSELSNI